MEYFTAIILAAILITVNLFSQTQTFLLGFSGTYPSNQLTMNSEQLTITK